MNDKAKDEAANNDAADDADEERAKNGSSADKSDSDDEQRFERRDNLRRRSEWFQKRTGGD